MNKVCFLHIPKTGGTTFAHILKNNYKYDKILELVNIAEMIINNKHNELIIGHFGFGATKYIRKNYILVTILRNPIDRVISLYYFIKNNQHHHLYNELHRNHTSIEAFVGDRITGETNNAMTRMLASEYYTYIDIKDKNEIERDDLNKAIINLKEDFTIVGILEEFDKFLLLCKLFLNLRNIYYTRKNVTIGRPTANDISYDIRRIIEKENVLDIELYESAKILFHNKLRAYDKEIEMELFDFQKRNRRYGYINDILSRIKWIIGKIIYK